MFNTDDSVMLLVDVQGQLAQLMHEKEALFKSLEAMIQGMKVLGVPIIWLEQIPSKLGPTTDRIAAHMEGVSPIEKFSFSCCGEPEFMKQFEALGRKQVLITGIETHICVFQTGVELMEKGCEVQVVADCVSSRTKANKKIGLKRLAAEGARVTSVEMAFFELMKAAQGDAFKQVVKFIK
ncbi:MAG TPA: hydrolase [Desulfobacteraceae bacterium]|nr:hydrolase [Desulfobacteraceae bacterium]